MIKQILKTSGKISFQGSVSNQGDDTLNSVITGSGGDVTATTDDAVTLSDGAVGTFGTIGGAINNNSLTPITFTYDSRLDSTGGSDVNIFDTGITGSLSGGKYFRITNNGVNVKSLTGITKVVAKNLSLIQTPPADTVFIDPASGKYVLPMPSYHSKCENAANLTTPEISASYYGVPSKVNYNETIVSGKFGNALSDQAIINAGYPGSGIGYVYPFGSAFTGLQQGTISFWIKNYVYNIVGAGVFDYMYWNFGNGMQIGVVPVAGYYVGAARTSFKITDVGGDAIDATDKCYYVNSGNVWGTTHPSPITDYFSSQFRHCYIVWDKINKLGNGKDCKFYVDGNLVATDNFFMNPSSLFLSLNSWSTYVYNIIDNIKIWNHAIDDTSMEYNSGSGRESALHPCYGSGNNYAPSTNTVRYYRSGWNNNRQILSLRNS